MLQAVDVSRGYCQPPLAGLGGGGGWQEARMYCGGSGADTLPERLVLNALVYPALTRLLHHHRLALSTVDLDLCVAQGAGYALYLLYWYKSTDSDGRRRARGDGCALFLLYWYKSTNTDATAHSAAAYCRRYSVYLLYWWKSTHTAAPPVVPALS